MDNRVFGPLAAVRWRQQLSFAFRAGAYGLLVGSVVGLAAAAARRWLAAPVELWQAALPLVIGPALGILIGFGWRRGWQAAAVAVDRHYRLKDRAATALEFVARPTTTDLHQLQIADAAEHLVQIEPRRVVPWQLPRTLPYAIGALALAAAFLAWPLPSAQVVAKAPAPQEVIAEAERLQEALQDLEEAARNDENPELQKLVEELRRKAEEMKQPGIDEREALAKLSEMQAAVQSQMAQYNTALVDGQLQALGGAMSLAMALEGTGKALQESKLEKAAQELEKLEDPKLDRKEAKAVDEKMRQVAKDMGDAGLGQLSGAVSEFADAVKGGKSKAKRASKVLAREVSNQARRRRITNLLEAELDRLKEGKCNCQCNGGARVKKPVKSTTPSSTWGRSISGNVEGEKSNLLGQRNQVDLTGTPGEGPSDVETTASPEARQQAQRGYRDVYQKYRKMSEAVLDSELIPLGQRQMIRRYFELIRPQNEPADGSAPAPRGK